MIRPNPGTKVRSEPQGPQIERRALSAEGRSGLDVHVKDRSDPPPRGAWAFVKRLASQFSEDEAMTLAAAMSFYTALAMAPLIIVALSIAGAVWGQQAAGQEMISQIDRLMGEQGAQLTKQVIAKAAESQQTGWAAGIGIAMLLFAASSLFAQLQYALNRIWDVKTRPGKGLIMFIRKRVLSLGMVLAVGFLLLVSLVVSAAVHAATESVRVDLPGGEVVWQVLTLGLSLLIFTALFAAMFKALPDAEIEWRMVWIGAAVTAVLFVIGKQLIGLYLGRGTVGSTYGAAGSLLVVLVWVYYSSIIFFLGAEFTQVYSVSRGHAIVPSKNAVRESA